MVGKLKGIARRLAIIGPMIELVQAACWWMNLVQEGQAAALVMTGVADVSVAS